MIKINDKNFPVSFSQNRLYTDCPRKYKFRYVDGIPEPDNPNLQLGTAIHNLLENQFWKNKDFEQNEQYIFARNIILKQKGLMYFKQLTREIEDFFADKEILFNELVIKNNDYTAKIDIVYKTPEYPDKIIVADFKVTKKPKTDDTIFDEGQLLFYQYLINAVHNGEQDDELKNIMVQYINILSYQAAKLLLPTTPTSISDEACINFARNVDANVNNINNGLFPKKKKWCNWCFYKDRCDTEA
jgi:CRISPR/Cas system-associated exonuclease Cas4 (RecB family)